MKKSTKKFLTIMVTVLLTLGITGIAYAADPTFVTKGKKLLDDALTWVLILIPAAGSVAVGWNAMRRAFANGDSMKIADADAGIKNALIATAIGESAAAIINVMVSYFQ